MTEIVINPRKVNKDSPIPYYYQIIQVIKESIEDIEDKESHAEIQLPSESDFCEMFSVNRGTIRHALDLLEREGLIYREKGRGAFVRCRRMELDLSYLCSTTEDIKNRGWKPQTEVLSFNKISPRSHIRSSLDLGENEQVWEVYRRRLANEEPISLQRTFLPVALMPDLDKHDLTQSFYKIWQDVYNIQPRNAEQTIRTRSVTSEEAKLLTIFDGDPIFEITRVTFDINNRPFEYLNSVWRGDRYDFNVRMTSR